MDGTCRQVVSSVSATTSAVACLAAGRGFHRGCPVSRTRPSEAHCLAFLCQSSVGLPFNLLFEGRNSFLPMAAIPFTSPLRSLMGALGRRQAARHPSAPLCKDTSVL